MREGQLSSYLTYDEPTSRYISLVRVADAHLSPDATLTAETDVRKRTLLNVVAHYAAQKLVADREIGAYLKLFIERTRASQLQGLVPDILSIITDIEDKAVKTDVKLALAKRLQARTDQDKVLLSKPLQHSYQRRLLLNQNQSEAHRLTASWCGIISGFLTLKSPYTMKPPSKRGRHPPALQTTSTNAKGEYKFGMSLPEITRFGH